MLFHCSRLRHATPQPEMHLECTATAAKTKTIIIFREVERIVHRTAAGGAERWRLIRMAEKINFYS